jgi:uncharacterized protein YgbK (DUF1537 family)
MLLDVPTAWPDGVQVLAVDLDARELSATAARQAAERAARRLPARLFLKIDSTLRGPIGALVEGALEGSGSARAVVAPAFPEQGRLFHAGWLYVDGQRTQAHLAGVLGEVAARCDLDDGVDLDAIAQAWPDRLLVGSGGLARRIAGPGSARPLPVSAGPVLIEAGSPSPATQSQLEALPPHLEVLRTPPTDARDAGQAAATLAREVAARPARPGLLVLTGGQTARSVCTQLGAHGVHLLGEVMPGLPVGRLRGGLWDGLLVVTKAGGFGGPRALLDALRALSPSSLETS